MEWYDINQSLEEDEVDRKRRWERWMQEWKKIENEIVMTKTMNERKKLRNVRNSEKKR